MTLAKAIRLMLMLRLRLRLRLGLGLGLGLGLRLPQIYKTVVTYDQHLRLSQNVYKYRPLVFNIITIFYMADTVAK
jgi:hypothetical protein